MNWGKNASNNGVIGYKDGTAKLYPATDKHKAYIAFKFYDTGNKIEVVRVYTDSMYTSKEKAKCPVKISLYASSAPSGAPKGWSSGSRSGKKIGDKSGSGYVVDSGKYRTRSGVENRPYVKITWLDSSGNVLRAKLYYQSMYTTTRDTYQHCPVKILAYHKKSYSRDFKSFRR